MALREVKYNDTTIYIEDEISDKEKGFATLNENILEKTQELNLKEELEFLEETQEMNFDLSQITQTNKISGEEYE